MRGCPLQVEAFPDEALSQDDFLGGRVHLYQPRAGYRAGVDPVFLAASVPARAGQSVLELGCGAGPALCCLGVRVPGLRLAGLELQPAYAALCRRNLAANALEGTVWEGDLRAPPADLRSQSFDHVMMNPPYFLASERRGAEDAGREIALAGETPLSAWIDTAARRLRPRGYLHVILRAERLPELMGALSARLGSLELLPLVPRIGRAPRLILMRARKEGRAPFRFHPALILHEGAHHTRDSENYAPQITSVVRDGGSLPFPGQA